MTNSSNSSRKSPLKLIVIHGLNNNELSFVPLVTEFKNLGHTVHFVVLPIHGEDRAEASDYQEAAGLFDKRLKGLKLSDYGVIAFSQGALYFDLWLRKNPDMSPRACVYLAPSFHIRRHRLIDGLLRFIPDFLPILSLSPREFTRYDFLKVSEYKLLLSGIQVWLEEKAAPFTVPTLVLIDPQDELVDAKRTQALLEGVELISRPELGFGLGVHHILFHPNYFSPGHWAKFISRIEEFFSDC